MLIMYIHINELRIDKVGIINTGHKNKKTGKHLYRINYPELYKEKFNKYEIWHNRKDSWPTLVKKVMTVLQKDKDLFDRKRKDDDKDIIFNL